MDAESKTPAGASGGGSETACVDSTKDDGTILPPSKCESQPPVALVSVNRWITWRLVPQDDGDTKKVPVGSNGRNINCTDPNNWRSYEDARAHAPEDGGVGFVFTDDDMLGGIDLDGCRDPETGTLTTWAREIVTAFGSYTEVSPSGTGVKIFADGAMPKLPASVLPMPGEAIKGKRPQVEAYVTGRYFAFTGDKLPEVPNEVRDSTAWLTLYKRLEKAAAESGGERSDMTEQGRNGALFSVGRAALAKLPEGTPDEDCETAVRRAMEAANYLGNPLHPSFANGPVNQKEFDQTVKSVLSKNPGGREERPRSRTWRTEIRSLTLEELGKRERPSYLVKGLLNSASVATLIGEPGAWKSFLAIDLAMHVALNRSWCERRVRGGPVLYVACEGGGFFGDRITAWRQHNNEWGPIPLHVFPEAVNLGEVDRDAGPIADEVQRLKAKLVVIDTLHQALFGNDENGPGIETAMALANEIRIRTGVTVLFVHHSGWGNTGRGRGHSSQRGDVDTELLLARKDDVAVLKATKQKDLPDDLDLGFKKVVVDIGVDEDGDKITSLVLELTEDRPSPSDGDKTYDKALGVLRKLCAEQRNKNAGRIADAPEFWHIAPVEAWRRACYDLPLSKGQDAAKRKAFREALEKLQKRGDVKLSGDGEWAGAEWAGGGRGHNERHPPPGEDPGGDDGQNEIPF